MACQNCNNEPISFSYSYPRGCVGSSSSNCTCTYTGTALPCSGIANGDTFNEALVKIDAQICSIAGDYSTYNFNCLTTWLGSSITTEAEFVDAITAYACEIKSDLDTFIDTTFTNYQTFVEDEITGITNPEITCAAAGVTSADSLVTVLNKYCTLFGTIKNSIDLSGVGWNECFTVVSPPTTISGAIDVLIGQICTLKNTSPVLPTFDNTANCLDGGAVDTLEQTIQEIITRLCVTPIWNTDEDDVEYGCLPQPYTGGGVRLLQNVVNNILYSTNALLSTNVVNWSGDFVVEQANPLDSCSGINVSLATPINQDRKVATSATDTNPSELIDKLAAGSNITINEIGSNPSKQIEIAAVIDHKVLASNTDDTPDFLVDKLTGDTSNGISLTPTYNISSKKVDLDLEVDMDTFVYNVLAKISGDSALKSIFCSIVNTCIPQACAQYTVTNSSGSTKQITYVDCAGLPVGPLFIADGGNLTFCAQLNSVVATGCTVVNDGECTTTSTTTISNVDINNDSTDVVISAIEIPVIGGTYNFLNALMPINPSNSATGSIISGTYDFSFIVASASIGQSISVIDSLGNSQCIDIAGAGTYTLSSVVVNNTTTCVFYVNAFVCAV